MLCISFAFVYAMMSIGVVKSTHFCMGRAKHTAVFAFDAKKCVCAKYNPDNNCCDDEHELIQITNDHAGSISLTAPVPNFNFIAEIFAVDLDGVTMGEALACERELILPPKIPIYKRAHSLLFYDPLA